MKKEIIEALEAIGFVQVEDNGYASHDVPGAEQILFYNPESKEGLSIWKAPPDTQEVFDEYYMQEVDDKFGTEILKRNKT
jgi:hypothetical protein